MRSMSAVQNVVEQRDRTSARSSCRWTRSARQAACTSSREPRSTCWSASASVEQAAGVDLQAGRRSSRPNTSRLSRKCGHVSVRAIELGEDAAAERFDVFLRLEQHADRVVRRDSTSSASRSSAASAATQSMRLRHAGHLVELLLPQLLHDRRDLRGEPRGRVRHALPDDGELLLERRVLDPLIQAAALERVVHLARAVRGQDDERRMRRRARCRARES